MHCVRLISYLFVLAVASVMAAQAADRDFVLRGHGGPVKSVALNADGTRALSASFDYSIMYWDVTGSTPKMLARFTDHDAAVNSVAFVPGGHKAISASDDGTVTLWSLTEKKLLKRFKGHSHKVVRVAVSADGRWAISAAWDRTARLWNLQTHEAGPILKGHGNTINDVAFAADGKSVFTASYDGTIRQWLIADGRFERLVYNHGWGVNTIQALPGGRNLVFGALDGVVGVFDLVGNEVSAKLADGDRPILSMTQLPGKDLVAAAGGDGIIRVWDTHTWRVKFEHKFPYGPVWGMALTADGTSMYFTGLDDHVAYWQMRPDKPFDVVQSKLPRRFQAKDAKHPGALQFARKCSICHTLTPGDANRAGPSLYGVFGRRVGTLPGYPYSKTLQDARFVWSEQTIDRLFALGPENFVPGTKMPLQKMDKAHERKALIDYLKTATRPKAGVAQ